MASHHKKNSCEESQLKLFVREVENNMNYSHEDSTKFVSELPKLHKAAFRGWNKRVKFYRANGHNVNDLDQYGQ